MSMLIMTYIAKVGWKSNCMKQVILQQLVVTKIIKKFTTLMGFKGTLLRSWKFITGTFWIR